MKCGGALAVAFAIGLAGPNAFAAAPENRFCVVVVPEDGALTAHLQSADRGLRKGLLSTGGELMDSLAPDLSREADRTTGECAEDCEARMRSKPLGAKLIVLRVTTSADRFVLRASMGLFRSDSASGVLPQLEEAASAIGRRLASTESLLVLRGGTKNARWFLDGRAIEVGPDRTIKVTPGRHVIRIGLGQGPRALRMVDVVMGDRVEVTFPEGLDGNATSRVRPARGTPFVAPATTKPTTKKRRRGPWATTTGFAVVSRQRSISGAAGTGYSTRFWGAGPDITARFCPGLAIARLDFGWTSFPSAQRFSFGEGGTASADGGDSIRGRGLIGYEHTIQDTWSLAVFGGGGWESHRADDPRGLGLLSSYQRASVESELAASLNLAPILGMKRPVTLGAHLGVTPWSSWIERPAGVSGEKPKAGVGVSWGARSEWALGPHWGATISYRGELRSVRYSGLAEAPVSPAIERATVREFFNVGNVAVNRSF